MFEKIKTVTKNEKDGRPKRPCPLLSSLHACIPISVYPGRTTFSYPTTQEIYYFLGTLSLVEEIQRTLLCPLQKSLLFLHYRTTECLSQFGKFGKKKATITFMKISKVSTQSCIELHHQVKNACCVFNGASCTLWCKDGRFFRFFVRICPRTSILQNESHGMITLAHSSIITNPNFGRSILVQQRAEMGLKFAITGLKMKHPEGGDRNSSQHARCHNYVNFPESSILATSGQPA